MTVERSTGHASEWTWRQDLSASPAAERAPPEAGSKGQASLGRSVLFVATFLLAWVSINPFESLSDARWLQTTNTSDLLNQLAYVGLGVLALSVLLRSRHAAAVLLRPVYVLTLAWLLVSVATSLHVALSARRLGFLLFVLVLGAAAPLLPANRQRFADLLAGVTVGILVLCYVGVALVPDLAIHQATDLVEPRLAGNWRGVFVHKNIAGEMMGLFVFVGLFTARARSVVLGWGIVVAALVFLAFTEAKSAMAFLPLILLLAWTSPRAWAVRLRLGVFFLCIVILNALSIGSLYSPGLQAVADSAFSDPTFTGRTEIWQIAIDWIPKRPLLGFGYGAFWQTDEVMYAASADNDGGAATAEHAHNAVLNLAVTTGIPGALLALCWTVVMPLRDLERCRRNRADPALTNLFLRIWAFAIANCSFESILFARGDPMWFTMLVAMFGLFYLSRLAPPADAGDR